MKTLVEYIKEASEEKQEVPSSKTFTFNFNGMDGVEDFIKSVQELEAEGVEVEDEKLKITVKKENPDACDKLYELVQDFVHAKGKDSQRASNELYADKVSKLEKALVSWSDYIEDAANANDDNSSKEKESEEKDKNKEEE